MPNEPQPMRYPSWRNNSIGIITRCEIQPQPNENSAYMYHSVLVLKGGARPMNSDHGMHRHNYPPPPPSPSLIPPLAPTYQSDPCVSLLCKVAVACGAESVLAAMVRPGWVSACLLDAPDESEAQLTALDLAVRPPAKVNMLRCLLACGATPTARVILKLIRNAAKSDGGGGSCGDGSVVRECFLGAVAASEWAVNPLIPGLNLSVALIEASRQVSPWPGFGTTVAR